jgi:hypothetical protein
MFPRGLDGLYLPPVAGVDVLALVERGSPDEAWMQQCLPTEQVLAYTLRRDLGIYPSTQDLLQHSDIHAVLRKARASGLLLSCSCSAGIHAWARRHRVPLLLSGDYAHQRLEDKLWFDAFLRRHRIPRPAGGAYTIGRRARLPVDGPAVLQLPDSMGGEGTFFLDGADAVAQLVARGLVHRGDRSLVRARIDGRPYGITVTIAPSTIALSAIRLQCYYAQPDAASGQSFAGIQWVAASELSATLTRRINRVFGQLGELLYRRRFFGVANFDFMIDGQERVFLLECNPRMSAATPQLLCRRELSAGVEVGELLLRSARGPRTYPRARRKSRLPPSQYQGATLELVHKGSAEAVVQRTFPSGSYDLDGDSIRYRGPHIGATAAGRGFAVVSFARPGQRCHRDETLGSVVSHEPLFDGAGALLPRAQRLLAHFRYTDDRPGS